MNTNFCDQIDDYLDGDIEPQFENQWRDHIASCQHCKQLVQQYFVLKHQIQQAWLNVEQGVEKETNAARDNQSSVNVDLLKQKSRLQNKQTKSTHWIWAIVPIIVVALSLGLFSYFVVDTLEITERDTEDRTPIQNTFEKALVVVESKDIEDRDFVETIESNDEYTLVRYHQGVELTSTGNLANPASH